MSEVATTKEEQMDDDFSSGVAIVTLLVVVLEYVLLQLICIHRVHRFVISIGRTIVTRTAKDGLVI